MSLPYLLFLSAALNLYIGARIIPSLPGWMAPLALASLLLVSALMLPLGLFARRKRR